MVIENFSAYFLIFCLVVSSVLLFNLFKPFFTILILAAILATAFHPLYQKLLRRFKGRQRLASVVSCLLILILIIVPLIIFILLLSQQAFDNYKLVQHNLQDGFLEPYIKWQKGGIVYDFLNNMKGQFGSLIDLESLDLKKSISDNARSITTFLAAQSTSIIKGFGRLLLDAFVLFFALYYFFKDSKIIVKRLLILSPLPEEHEKELLKKFKEISLATLYGMFLTSITQGIIGGIGFAIAGIPNALFWGTAIALFSMVPLVGTSFIWLPTSLILIFSGSLFPGIFLFLWGLLLVSTVDNFLRAYLIGGRTNMNQLLTFLAVFGGIGMFGLVGVIFGPLILTLFFTFLHIYEIEYRPLLHHKPSNN